MFGALTIPFAIETYRRSPIRVAVRNLAFTQGDDVIIAVQVYGPGGITEDITYADVSVVVQRDGWGFPGRDWGPDYGAGCLGLAQPLTWASTGIVTNGPSGQAQVTIPRIVTANWWGRFRFFLGLYDGQGACISAEGVLVVRRGSHAAPPALIAASDFSSGDFLPADFFVNTDAIVVQAVSVGVIGDDALVLLT